MSQRFSPTLRLRALLTLAIATAVLCLGSRPLHAQAPLCTLSFNGTNQPPILEDSARGCLNRATEQYRLHPGAHIALAGPIAADVSAARRYLIIDDSLPAAAVVASTTPGNLGYVQVTLVLPPAARANNGAPAGGMPEQPKIRSRLNERDVPEGGALARSAPQQLALVQPARVQPAPVVQPAVVQPVAPLPDAVEISHPAPVAGQPIGAPTSPKSTDPYVANEQVQDWENQLKTGNIDFNNPGTMVVGKATGIVVVIHGYLDQSHSDLQGVVGQGNLRVSDSMRVDLTAPLAPGEFQITPSQGAVLPVPLSGSATWEFQVTPTNETSKPQTLVIQPYLIAPGKYGAQPLHDRQFFVEVTVESFWQHIRDLWNDDPVKVVKYFLPGGEGWSGIGAFFTGLIALLGSLGVIAWIKRKIDAQGNPKKGSSDS